MKWISALVVFGLGLPLLLAAEPRPNVVLIISDDQAWTDYSFMGHPQIRTPHLDRLAAESLLFRRGYVPSPLCCPSLASIITGRYAHQHKITSNDGPIPPGMTPLQFRRSPAFGDAREVMNRHLEAQPTLPRILAQAGYLSLQTGKWWQGHYTRGGFTHGMTQGERHGDEGLKIGRETMEPIYQFIEESRKNNQPFFIWYAPMLPHQPHNPPQRLFDRYKDRTDSPHVARYWAMVEWFDETCGELLQYLDRQRLAENTIVIYVTDNGWIQDPNANRFAPRSKQTPYEGGVRTPVMFRWPGKITPRDAGDLASSIDIVPTLLHLLRLQRPPDLPGINLLDPSALRNRNTLYGEYFSHNAVDLNVPAKNLLGRWIIDGSWKLILPIDSSKTPELYDVLKDPHETVDQAKQHTAIVTRLTAKLDTWWNPRE